MSVPGSFLGKLKALDAYPKFHDEVRVRTFSGATVSLVAIFLIVILFISELSLYLELETVDHLLVDTSRGDKLKINFDVNFPRIPCPLLSVDAMDVSGFHQLDVSHHIQKKPLDAAGKPKGKPIIHDLGHSLAPDEVTGPDTPPREEKPDPTKEPGYCGSCYGAEDQAGQCCNTCDEVKSVYRKKGWAVTNMEKIEQCVVVGETQKEFQDMLARGEGCQVFGYLEVNKVAGNFHFAPGRSFQHAHMHVHDLAAFSSGQFNVTHQINEISFGEHFQGMVNPLDGVTKELPKDVKSGMYMYYAKVVPTSYSHLDGKVIDTNQYSITEHFRALDKADTQSLPGVFIFYELSPIMVRFTERRRPITHFLTQLCAILGGVFTVAGIIDRLVYNGTRLLEKKLQMNKLS